MKISTADYEDHALILTTEGDLLFDFSLHILGEDNVLSISLRLLVIPL